MEHISQGSDINEFLHDDINPAEQKTALEKNISDRTQEVVRIFNDYRNEE